MIRDQREVPALTTTNGLHRPTEGHGYVVKHRAVMGNNDISVNPSKIHLQGPTHNCNCRTLTKASGSRHSRYG